jgi:hypothetical protein
LIVEVYPFIYVDVVSIVTVVVEDVNHSVIVFRDNFSISCFLEDLSNHAWSHLPIPRGILIEDFLENVNNFVLEGLIFVE